MITVSWSEIDTYRQCPFKWKLAYKDRYSKPVADDSPLGKGLLWHTIIETRYNVLMHWQETDGSHGISPVVLEFEAKEAVEDVLAKATKDGVPDDVTNLMRWMYAGYVETYGLDDDHTILGVETTHFAPLGTIELPDKDHPEVPGALIQVPVQLKFKIDRIVRNKFGQIIVIDEKSHAALPSDNDYDFLDQFGLYVWGLSQLGMSVRGAIHSASKTKQNQGDILSEGDPGWKSTMRSTPLENRYKRTPINYTKAQLVGVAQDALADVQQMYGPANHCKRHTDSDRCKWRCSFTEACLFGRRTGKDSDTIRMLEIQGFTQNHERH